MLESSLLSGKVLQNIPSKNRIFGSVSLIFITQIILHDKLGNLVVTI